MLIGCPADTQMLIAYTDNNDDDDFMCELDGLKPLVTIREFVKTLGGHLDPLNVADATIAWRPLQDRPRPSSVCVATPQREKPAYRVEECANAGVMETMRHES
jgi:hypothetical protein